MSVSANTVGARSNRKEVWFSRFLKLSAAIGIIAGSQYFLFPEAISESIPGMSAWVMYVYGIACAAGVFGIVLMMRWRKMGYWIWLASCILGIGLNALFFSLFENLLGVLLMAPMFPFLYMGGADRLWLRFE